MTFATGTLGASAGMVDGALQQGTAQDLGGVGESAEEFLAGLNSAFVCHL